MYMHPVKHGKGNSPISKKMGHKHNAPHTLRAETVPRSHTGNPAILAEPHHVPLNAVISAVQAVGNLFMENPSRVLLSSLTRYPPCLFIIPTP